MLTDYRFFRVANGKPAFAWVHVERIPRADDMFTITDATDEESDSVHKNDFPEWIDAAMKGCCQAVKWIRETSWPHGFDVRLKKVQITIADTRDDAVECAAYLATAKAFSRIEDVSVSFDGRWNITPG